ncbi:MAG: pyrroline-5-carboxylate reductase [Kiritimatiellia bacterium]|jgi:pyrroline-5-carboxylate reductase|nr:pyrroline-5-carboxylate reductase [Kiritimatiellia bacterium]
MKNKRITFLGGGNMAEAILSGMLTGDLVLANNIVVADISAERRAWLQTEYGVDVTPDNAAAVGGADIVVLAVKPQQAAAVLAGVRDAFSDRQILISICAGLTTAALEVQTPARVARVMPNLPALISCGVAAICGGSRVTTADLDLVERIFAATGVVVRVPEQKMNEVTALSGSGPGYVFAFIEALEAAGIGMGLAADTARTMAIETVRGAAEMAAQTSADPAELRRRVSSKGGTTLAGLAAMEAGGFSAAVAAGMAAARDRADELAR